jgi:tetratricopeptide (TPR) repeat protein
MKKTILIVLFLFFISNTIVCSQTYTKGQIDSLLVVGEKYIYAMNGKTKPLALYIIKHSYEIKYTHGVISGYELIIAHYCFSGEFKTALEYIALAEKEIPKVKDSTLFIGIIRLKGDCFSRTGLYQRARKEFSRSLRLADEIKNKDTKHGVKANIYNSIAITIAKQDKTNDSVFYYYRKCISEFQQRTDQEEGKKRSIAQANLNISTRFIQIRQYDSAAYYVQKTLKMLDKNDTSILKLNAQKNLGDLYLGKRDYDSAIYYYKSILDKAKATNQSYILSNTYSKLSAIYDILGNDQKSKEYQNKYTKINKEINQLEKEALEASVKNIEKKHDDDFESSQVIFISIICITLLAIGIILYFFIKKLKSIKEEKKKKAELLYEKEEELERLADSNKVTLQEVLQLAINKDASFNTKFQELEPDFYGKLNQKAIAPLNYNDLLFCAMIRLGFITKEIAQHLNSNVAAVESRKYRLRKKLNMVSSDEDLTIWMMNL